MASNDGQTNLIDPLPVDLPAGIDLTVIAIGDGNNRLNRPGFTGDSII